MNAAYLAQQLVNALTVSAFYGLLAVAYVLVHGVTGRVNLMFGALSVWAGYIVVNGALVLMLHNPGMTLGPVAAAILAAVASTTALGYVLERAALRPVIGERALAILVLTLALAIVLEELMRIINGSKEVWLMPILADPIALGAIAGGALHVPLNRIVVLAAALLLCLAVLAVIEWHRIGRQWRAVAENDRLAELCGIDTGRARTITFVAATALTATAGALSAVTYGSVSFYSGLLIGLKTLFVAVAGGLNSILGALVGAVLLGLMETLWSAYFDTTYRDVASLLFLSGLMVLFPSGLVAGIRRIAED